MHVVFCLIPSEAAPSDPNAVFIALSLVYFDLGVRERLSQL